MSAPDTAMILAAGFGTRMGALTEATPKPLLRAGGTALIDHVLDLAAKGGVGQAVVNLHYRGDQIRAHLSGRARPRVTFSDEQPEILDTGGGLARAWPLLGPGPVFCLNSDAVFAGANPCAALAAAWDAATMDALLLLVPREAALAYTRPGDFFLDGAVPRRRADASQAPYVYTGAQIVARPAFEDAPGGAFSMNVVWNRLLARGRVAAVCYPGAWVDVGTEQGLAAAALALDGRPA